MKTSSAAFTAFLVALVALPAIVPAAHAQPAVDERAIIETVSALDAALDAKDWASVRELLLDEVTLDLPGRDAATVSADDAVSNWQAQLHPDKLTFRLRGGEQVIFDGADSVVVRSKAHVLTQVDGVAGDDLHELWSDYHHELDRTENGWRVRHYGFVPRLERGNIGVVLHQPITAASGDETPPDAASSDTTEAEADLNAAANAAETITQPESPATDGQAESGADESVGRPETTDSAPSDQSDTGS